MVRCRSKLLLLLLVVLVLLPLGIVLFHLHATRTPYLLAQAHAALERGDWDEAARLAGALEQSGPAAAARLVRGKTWTYAGRAAAASAGSVGLQAPAGGAANARAADAFRHALGELTRLRDGGALGLEGTVLGAECLVRLGERRLAAEALTAVVERQPDDKEAHRLLAAIYIDLNSPFAAIEELREWARLDPHTGRPYRWIGFFYKDYQHPTEAVEAYREACRRELEPADRTAVLQELAETLCDAKGEYQAALDTLAEGPAEFQDRPAIQLLRGRCLWGLGRAAEAVVLVESALGEDRHVPQALLWRAKMWLAEGQPRAALPLLEEAVGVDPGDLESRQYLMQTYGLVGEPRRAEEERRRTEELKGYKDRLTQLHEQARRTPWDDRVRCQIADLCQRVHRPSEARMWLEAALACNPNNAEARARLDRAPAPERGPVHPVHP
jgi:predicted Zn-dependent protease